MPYKPGLPAIWQAGLGQGHNQKKDTHTLDFDVTLIELKFCMTKGKDPRYIARNSLRQG